MFWQSVELACQTGVLQCKKWESGKPQSTRQNRESAPEKTHGQAGADGQRAKSGQTLETHGEGLEMAIRPITQTDHRGVRESESGVRRFFYNVNE
jgi:hypothetical protein